MPEYFLPRRVDAPAESDAAKDAAIVASEGVRSRTTDEGIEIELPEGQRITIGTLPPGTVVEVISWQGTGSPGPKASRLLLGTARTEETTVRITATADAPDPVAAPLAPAEVVAPQVPSTPTAETIGMPARSSRLRAWLRGVAWAAVAVALVLVPQSLGVVRWTVVDRGPSWALGGTRGSIAIATGDTDVAEGSRAIVRPHGSGEDWFGDVVATDDGGFVVRVGSISVPTEGRAHTVPAIVPWLGYPVIWVRSLFG